MTSTSRRRRSVAGGPGPWSGGALGDAELELDEDQAAIVGNGDLEVLVFPERLGVVGHHLAEELARGVPGGVEVGQLRSVFIGQALAVFGVEWKRGTRLKLGSVDPVPCAYPVSRRSNGSRKVAGRARGGRCR